jgi:uncharacterized protein
MSTTEIERDNIGLVRQGFESFAAGNMAALSELFDANAVWHSAPAGILKGDYHGRDAIFAMFGQLHQETAGTFHSKPITMAASGDKVFVQTKAASERRGRSLDTDEVLIFKLANDRVTEVRLYYADYSGAATFWA